MKKNTMFFALHAPTVLKANLSLFILVFTFLDVNAQQIPSARLTALGGLSTAVSTDIDAIGTNPANLMEVSRGKVVFELIPFSIKSGSDFLNLDLYNNYFTGTGQVDSTGKTIGKYLSESDKQNILDAFPSGVGNVRTDENIRWLGVSIRNLVFALGFSVDEKVGAQAAIPNTFASFALNLPTWGSNYSWNDLALKSFWYRTYNVDYAMKLPDVIPIPKQIAKDFNVGIGLKYVTGFSYTSMQSTNTSLYADSANDSYSYIVNMGFDAKRAGLMSSVLSKAFKSNVPDTVVHFNPFAPQGTGFGVDIGVNGIVMNFIKVGISFTDIGAISWSKKVVLTHGDTTITFSGFTPAYSDSAGSTSNLDSINNVFKNYFKNRDIAGSSFSTWLPTKLNIGASAQLDDLFPKIPGQLLVAIDYHQGFNNQFNNSTTPEFVLGAEWRPIYPFPIRTGLGLGGAYGFRWSAGFGFNLWAWDFDIGIGTLNAIVAPNAAKNVSVTLSILKFRI
ncbi:MAG TPA: DUF5723 family protein [Candidatus Acidoferrales bacterium]|nr:DUF5723 family protein [Candidatus Acidoferrales bacterium]